jgi:hypothetical protein
MNSIDKAKKIIDNSGNNFHCKVINYFNSKDWEVLISPYYTDNQTNKSREIDLIVEKSFPQEECRRYIGSINVRLYIECKYIPHTNVFWFANKDTESTNNLLKKIVPKYNDSYYIEKHHYLEDKKVAKLFSGGNEVIYKALNQTLNSMVYYRNMPSIMKKPHANILATLMYPLIVCNSFDNFFRTEIDSDKEPVSVENNFQLEVNYAYLSTDNKSINEFFLIDMIDFNRLDEFLSTIENDIYSVSNVVTE